MGRAYWFRVPDDDLYRITLNGGWGCGYGNMDKEWMVLMELRIWMGDMPYFLKWVLC